MSREYLLNEQVDIHFYDLMKDYFPIVTFKNEEIITYRNHIPRIGMILIKGEIELIKTKTSTIVSPPQIIGLKELWGKTPVKYKVKVFPGTEVLSLDLSTLRSLVKNKLLDLEYLKVT